LEKQGVIKKYSLVVNHSKLGFENLALVGLDVKAEKFLEVAKEVKKLEEVKYFCSSTGDHMFMLKILAKDNDHLSEISDKLKKIDGVLRICPAIVKESLKGTL